MKQINAYLNFDGNCREAMTFYARCLDAELRLVTFSEMPGEVAEGMQNRIMHGTLTRGAAVLLMASDTPGGRFQQGNNVWLNIPCESRDEIDRLFASISEGGTVMMSLHDAFWGARFGMLTDRFGVHWMFNYEIPK